MINNLFVYSLFYTDLKIFKQHIYKNEQNFYTSVKKMQ